jgi:hypothetical protein
LGPMLNMAAAKVGDSFCCRVKVSNLCTLHAATACTALRNLTSQLQCSSSNSGSHQLALLEAFCDINDMKCVCLKTCLRAGLHQWLIPGDCHVPGPAKWHRHLR